MTRYAFGDYVVDTDTIEITGADGPREVEPQVFDVLAYFVANGGRLITKEELLDNVWGDRFVSESALTTRIKQARRAVGDDGSSQWAIKTVHGRGYRFLPDVATDPIDAPTNEPDPAETQTANPANPAPTDRPAFPDELGSEARNLFCGRGEELERGLDVVLGAHTTQAFGWVWLIGEAGIGKTRLAAEIAREAHDAGRVVLFGRNSEDLRVPYQPFLEVIRQAHLTGLADPDKAPAALAPLMPRIDPVVQAPSTGQDDETLRFVMFEAVAEWLDAMSTPLVIIIDDAHWAADSTLQLLGHLQGRPGSGRATFILTARDTAPDEHPRVAALLATAQGKPDTAVIRLSGLSDREAAALVGLPPDTSDLATIMSQTAGNPLFLQAVNELEGSIDLASAVQRRLLGLSEEVQETLRLVSVLGLEFDLAVAAAANDRDELDLLDNLEAAVAARLLIEVSADQFLFAHALIRASLRDQISAARRARLHGRAARAYEEVHGDDPAHLPALAHHTAEAATVDRRLRAVAVDRLVRAAAESSAQFSFEEAADLLHRARQLAPEEEALQGATLAMAQGIAQLRSGDNRTAAHTFAEAIDDARLTGDAWLLAEAAVRYEDASWRPGLPGALSLRYLDEAAAAIEEAATTTRDTDLLRARMAVARVRALAMAGQRAEAHVAFASARELATKMGSPDIEADVLSVFLGQVLFYEDLDASAEMVQRLVELEPEITTDDVALHAFHDRIMFSILTGRFDERRELVTKMNDLQARSHSSFWQFIRANQEAMDAFYQGDLENAEELAQSCLRLADQLPEEDGSGVFGLRMFLIRREQDQLQGLAPMIRQVLNQQEGAVLWAPGLAMLLAETGAHEEAADVVSSLRSSGFELPVDALWSTVMVFLIETMVMLDDREACDVLRDRFRSLSGTNVITASGLVCFGQADRYLGMLAFALGELDEAESLLGSALEGDAAGRSALWVNESRLWLSRVRRVQGHTTEADAMAEVVAREADAAGLARLGRLARTELA